MKNTNIKNINNIIAYTNNILRQNKEVNIIINDLAQPITLKLLSSEFKLFLRYRFSKLTINETYNKLFSLSEALLHFDSHEYFQSLDKKINRDTILNDINNFRKYYDYYSFSHKLEDIKTIYKNNDLSLELLNRYLDSSDYLFLKGLDLNKLNSSITTENNKYHNILIDLKTESIPKEFIYEFPISVLFKFDYLNSTGDIKNLDKKYYIDEFISHVIREDSDIYDNFKLYYFNIDYLGNYETYKAFKDLLKLYLDGINIYYYKGKHYILEQLTNIYKFSLKKHKDFLLKHSLEFKTNKDLAILDVIKYHPEVVEITYKCKNILDPEDILLDPLADLRLELVEKNSNHLNKKVYKITMPSDTITMKLSDFYLSQ